MMVNILELILIQVLLSIIMKKESQIEDTIVSQSNLSIIFAYYCRLTQQKLKHKNFDDVTQKGQMMDLHQFMTFCKDIKLTSKSKKLDSKRLETDPSAQTVINHQNVLSDNSKRSIAQVKSGKSNLHQTQKTTKLKVNISMDAVQMDLIGGETQKLQEMSGTKILANEENDPQKFLDQKKISKFFKGLCNKQMQINLDLFYSLLNMIAEEMYSKQRKKSEKQVTKQKQKNQLNASDSNLKKYDRKNQSQQNALRRLLHFLKLDTKQSILQFYKKANEHHGRCDHLSLLRTPVKKLHIKHDPLGKYAGKQNTSHSRLIQTINKNSIQKKYSGNTLPPISKNASRLNPLYKKVKKIDQQITHENIQSFLEKHKNQISNISKMYQYSNGNRVSFQPQSKDKEQNDQDLNMRTLGLVTVQKKQKKYSERHKDKVFGDGLTKQIGNLIEVSELYSDQIFNKYLQINHGTTKSKKLSQVNLNKSRMGYPK